MKTKIIFSLLVLFVNVGFSQNWSLFNLDQNSYYKQQYNDLAKVENFLMDSLHSDVNVTISYFNRNLNLSPDCYNNIILDLSNDVIKYKNPNKIDSLINKNDSVLFVVDIDTFIFKPFAQLNDSWVTNGITIRCSELGVLDVFGSQDSVKTYICSGGRYDNVEFILSKTYGLLKFLPFNNFIDNNGGLDFSPHFELIGYLKNGISHGYVQPDFNDYFKLSAGDMLWWRCVTEEFPILSPTPDTYYVDSIKYSYVSTDYVYYEFKRMFCDERGSVYRVYNNMNQYYYRGNEEKYLKNNTSFFGVSEQYIYTLNSLYFKVENNDTVTYAECNSTMFNTDICSVEFMDCVYAFNFSTREGITLNSNASYSSTYSIVLDGSIINGNVYGNITRIGIDNTNFENYRVYPNPFVDYINIESGENRVSKIEIFDAIGNLIVKEENVGNRINLELLPIGIYMLKITDLNNNTKQIKIVKQ